MFHIWVSESQGSRSKPLLFNSSPNESLPPNERDLHKLAWHRFIDYDFSFVLGDLNVEYLGLHKKGETGGYTDRKAMLRDGAVDRVMTAVACRHYDVAIRRMLEHIVFNEGGKF